MGGERSRISPTTMLVLVPFLERRGDVFFSPSVNICKQCGLLTRFSYLLSPSQLHSFNLDISVALKRRNLTRPLLCRLLSVNSSLKWFNIYKACLIFCAWRAVSRKRRIVLFTVSTEVPTLPARLWPGGSEITSASMTSRRKRERESWVWILCFLVVLFPECLLC